MHSRNIEEEDAKNKHYNMFENALENYLEIFKISQKL